MTEEETQRVEKIVAYAEGFRKEVIARGVRLELIRRLSDLNNGKSVSDTIQEFIVQFPDDFSFRIAP